MRGLAAASILFFGFLACGAAYAQVGLRPPEPAPMTVDHLAVRQYVNNFNPIRGDKMWFIVLLSNGRELNVMVHPNNVSVERGNAVGLVLSASGMRNSDPCWLVLQADQATLYAPDDNSLRQWQEYVDYLRAGLQRGLRNLAAEIIYRLNDRAVFAVRDSFWNFGDRMSIFAPLGGVAVVVDQNLQEGYFRVSAPGARVTFRGNGWNPVAHLESDTATLYVGTEREAEEMRQTLRQWQEEWNRRCDPRRIFPPPHR